MSSDSSPTASESGQDSEPAAKATTKSGAALLTSNVWLTAAAVAVFTTRAMWVKVRKLGLIKVGNDQKPKDGGRVEERQQEPEEEFGDAELDYQMQGGTRLPDQLPELMPTI